jgi:gliding motility-associated-like protein
MIFNRWGELIYETENPAAGWDGTYKGVLVQQDVYDWKAKYKTHCTNEKTIQKSGHVTVVR